MTGPLTVAGVLVMRLLIVEDGAVIMSGAGGLLADLAREPRGAVDGAVSG